MIDVEDLGIRENWSQQASLHSRKYLILYSPKNDVLVCSDIIKNLNQRFFDKIFTHCK